MKKSLRLVGLALLAVAAVFAFASCGDGGGGEGITIISGDPSTAILTKVGLTSSQFTQLKNIAGGGYYGYFYEANYYDTEDYGTQLIPMLALFYENKTEANFNTAKTSLNTIFNFSGNNVMGYESSGDYDDYHGNYSTEGGRFSNRLVGLTFFPSAINEEGLTLPAGTMIISMEYADFM